ncbi:MAG: micrococcal nuclease [Solirubrobacteraceae bacterium]|nr:micrococcal nuclease [Solirubrobacteraceae bacterium]
MLLVLAAVLGAGVVPGGGDEPAVRGAAGEALVTRVVDGDTAILEGLGRSRLIGIDTPEVHGRVECFGAEASRFAERTLLGRRVRFEVGAEPRDRYGRALIYVWLADGRFFNELLVQRGFARTLQIAPNVRFAARFDARAREARRAGRGLWSAATCSRR